MFSELHLATDLIRVQLKQKFFGRQQDVITQESVGFIYSSCSSFRVWLPYLCQDLRDDEGGPFERGIITYSFAKKLPVFNVQLQVPG